MPRNCPPLHTPSTPTQGGQDREEHQESADLGHTIHSQPEVAPWPAAPCFLGVSPDPPFSAETLPAEELLLCLSSSGGVASC